MLFYALSPKSLHFWLASRFGRMKWESDPIRSSGVLPWARVEICLFLRPRFHLLCTNLKYEHRFSSHMQNLHLETISNIKMTEDVILWATDCVLLPGKSRRLCTWSRLRVILSKKVSEKHEPLSSALPGNKWSMGLGEEELVRKWMDFSFLNRMYATADTMSTQSSSVCSPGLSHGIYCVPKAMGYTLFPKAS